jgi:hypothetical protein
MQPEVHILLQEVDNMQQPEDNRLLAAAHKLLVVDIGVMAAIAAEAVALRQPAVGAVAYLLPRVVHQLQRQSLLPGLRFHE